LAEAEAVLAERGKQSLPSFRNAAGFRVEDVPVVEPGALRRAAVDACLAGDRIVALLGLPDAGGLEVLLVLADDAAVALRVLRTRVAAGSALPSLASELPQAQAFERELHEQHGALIVGHPALEPLRQHPGVAGGSNGAGGSEAHRFFQVKGASVHEVAVGPVHAGIIEPGHFRFQCHGEEVLSLEIRLGYQHRGAEALLLESSPARRLVIAESIAGDTAVGHALAYCTAMESLAGAEAPVAAAAIRGILLELERVANHIGDLGALAGDVAYLPAASYFGRLRGNFLNLLMELSGNRYGRGLLLPGGVRRGLDDSTRAAFLDRIARDEAELEAVADLMFDAASVLARFERTGFVSEATARELGLVGVVARASGVARDVRHDHPAGVFVSAELPVAVAKTGDVMARALVRRLEVRRSLAFVKQQLRALPARALATRALATEVGAAAPGRMVVALVEGWRGEIAHVAVTDARGHLRAYKIVDPSFHNWFGLGVALRNNPISDFPLCNKSFNLSYAGHDL